MPGTGDAFLTHLTRVVFSGPQTIRHIRAARMWLEQRQKMHMAVPMVGIRYPGPQLDWETAMIVMESLQRAGVVRNVVWKCPE